MSNASQKITLLGAGAWGTAVAHLLADKGYTVLLWAHEPEVAEDIQKNRENSYYLPHVTLQEKITATASLQEAIAYSDLIFEAVPVLFLRQTLSHALTYVNNQKKWVVLSKGIEQETGLLATQILEALYARQLSGKSYACAVLSGPSFARELVEKKATAVMIATEQAQLEFGKSLVQMLSHDYFHCTLSHDLIGVQLAGALKNVVALMTGMLVGAGGGDNTRAWLLTEAFQELAVLTAAYGAQERTIYGLAGLGDLLLTSLGNLSKNMQLGMRIGKGEFLTREGVLPEGINTLKAIYKLLDRNRLQAPLIQAAYKIVFEDAPIEYLQKILLG